MTNTIRLGRSLAALAGLALACGCTESSAPPPPVAIQDSHEIHYVDEESDSLPHMIYGDGQLSLNDRCPVRRVKLNLRMPPLYVNGHPVGFC